MLGQGSSFQILDALLEVGEDGATREHLMRKADISVRTFYKHLKEMLKAGIVQERGNRYYFTLDTLYAFRFKKWRDIDRLYDLEEKARNAVLNVRNDATLSLEGDLMCLWLVGSAARGEMKRTSDLDFLAILRSETEYEPKIGNFELQWVTMKRSELLEKLQNGDEFAVSALREGLLLYEDGSAQKIYTAPLGRPSSSFFKEKESVVERFRTRFFEHLEFDELQEAKLILASLSETMLRLMLQTFGERTGGKHDLLNLAERYFSPEAYKDFSNIEYSEFQLLNKHELIELHRNVSSYYERFMARSEHLSSVARGLLYGHPVEFERSLIQIFTDLLGDQAVTVKKDFLIVYGDNHLLIDGKTLSGLVSHEHAESFFDHVERRFQHDDKSVGLFVTNSLREVPLIERAPEEENTRFQHVADSPRIQIISAIKLFQYYQNFCLLGMYKSYVLHQILLESIRHYIGNVLKTKLKRMEVRLRDWDHEDDNIMGSEIFEVHILSLELAQNDYYDNENAIGFNLEYSYKLKLDIHLSDYKVWNYSKKAFVSTGPVDKIIYDEKSGSGKGLLKKPGTKDAEVVTFESGISEITYKKKDIQELLEE